MKHDKYLKRLYLGFLIVLVLFNLYSFFLVKSNPVKAYELGEEGRFFEQLTVYLYFFSLVVSVYFIYKLKLKKIYYAIPVLCSLFMLEEISWLEKYIFREEYYITTLKIDALHDYVDIVYVYIRWEVNLYLIFIILVIISLIALLIFYFKIINFLKKYPSLFFLFIGIALLCFAKYIDVKTTFTPGDTFYQEFLYEEVVENNAAFFILLASFRLKKLK